MAVPSFQQITLPVLKFASDGQEHSTKEGRDAVAQAMAISQSDLEEMLPGGSQPRFINRFHWACVHLKKAGLLTSVRRGWFKITDHGMRVVEDPPQVVDLKFLKTMDAYQQWTDTFGKGSGKDTARIDSLSSDAEEATPDEIIRSAHKEIQSGLAAEILDRIMSCSPQFFEQLVIDLLVAMGYGGSIEDAMAVGRSGDGGIDGVIKEDKLGLDAVYVQAKRWESTVGRPVIQAFAGSLDGARARKGVVITTSKFSNDAVDYVSRIDKRIVLIDGKRLAELMIDSGVGTSISSTYSINQIDEDYYDPE